MNATGTSPVAEGRPDQPSVVVAEADVLAREGLATLLQHSSVEVHGVAAHMNELIKRIELSRPDVVVTPVDLPPAGANGGIAAALHIKRRFPLTGIVVLADDRGRDPAVDLLTRAATGIAYLVRGDIASLTDLVDVVRMAAKGGSAVDARVLAKLLRTREVRTAVERLSPREREVLRMIALGYSNRAIAESLHVAECTVESTSVTCS
jgi:DNA-binding NarL/FixJ family response regulator